MNIFGQEFAQSGPSFEFPVLPLVISPIWHCQLEADFPCVPISHLQQWLLSIVISGTLIRHFA